MVRIEKLGYIISHFDQYERCINEKCDAYEAACVILLVNKGTYNLGQFYFFHEKVQKNYNVSFSPINIKIWMPTE